MRYSMKKRCFIFLFLLLLLIPARVAFSQNIVVRGLLGSAETLFGNGAILSYNLAYSNLTGDAHWATPNIDALCGNFIYPWTWEPDDGFKVNQIGHPIQGSVSFSAGRVNGFGFYESIFFSMLGSSTWESLCESHHASINDFVTTVTGSITVGEILYRLYLEACAAGVPVPLATLLNPMAGFHRLITGWEPPNNDRNLYHLQYHIGMGFAQTSYSLSDRDEELFSFNGFLGELGFSLIYGNPFEQNSKIPFEQFEVAMSFGMDAGNYINIRFISEGYLFSFSPVYTDTNMMSTGLSLHMDFLSLGKFDMYDSTIDQFSNALNWTIKYQHLFPENTIFQVKFHAGPTFMGVSEYYSTDREKDLKNYGAGLSSKLFFTLEERNLGKFETSLFGYALWTYPGTSALSQGSVFWLFADITYSHLITKHLSLGITDFFAFEHGIFFGFPETWKYNNAIKLFVAWNF